MNYSLNFGKLTAPSQAARSVGDVFGLIVCGDFSGRANRGLLEKGDQLAGRKPRRVDVDNLDDVLASMQLKLHLPLGDEGGAVEVGISSLDDFHPDELHDNVEVFAELAGLRQRLQNSATYDAAAAEVAAWGADGGQGAKVRVKPRGAAIPNAKLSDFARLMGTSTAVGETTAADELIKQIVRPHIQAAADPDQPAMIAAVDTALASLMRRLLHHPDFQTLESLWRSVDLLVRELETDANLQIILYDISAEEVAADLSDCDDLQETGLYKLLVEQPALDTRTTAPSAIVGCYQFEQTPPHAELLGRVAKIAAAANAPFLAAVGNEAFEKKKPEEIHPLVAESWGALRSMPHTNYLGLTVPRFMLRWPYGAKTEPIDPFPFEEFTAHFGLKGFLWGNGAILAGLMLGKTFAKQGLRGMTPGDVMVQGDLPLYYYTDSDGDQVALPCTERIASEAAAAHIITQGFMPLLWMRGRPEVRLGSFVAVYGSQLAGPWAPVDVPADAAVEPPVDQAAPAPAAAVAPPPAAEPAPAAQPPAEVDEEDAVTDAAETEPDELDDLLSELEAPAPAASEPAEAATPGPETAAAPPPADDAADDELDALLAGLEGENEVDDEDAAGGDMDPDLAALLAEL